MVLSGWKDIAAYLRCGIRTVQRWERKGIPVHRPVPSKRSHVIAYSEELDWWIRDHQPHHPPPDHVVVTISRAKRLCEDSRSNLANLRARMQELRQEMTSLRRRRRKAS
jgi:phage terminase Nu1 subunit (DNA packaging protein)